MARANGFYFHDTMRLQCSVLGPGREEERGRTGEEKGEKQHMISTWECRNSEFISRGHTEGIKPQREKERGREGGRARGEARRKERVRS